MAGTHNTKLNIFDKIQPKFHKRFYTYCFLQARLKSQYLHTVNTKRGEQVRLGPSKSGFQIYFSPAFFRETFQWRFITACMLRSVQAETTRSHFGLLERTGRPFSELHFSIQLVQRVPNSRTATITQHS